MGALGQPVFQDQRARVMLVEDSAVVRGMVRNWLGELDCVEIVASAGNGRIALDQVAAAKPDIIILDIEMPVMDGITALPGLLRAAPGVKVLIASTLSLRNAQISMKALALGATDYVAKPSFARDGNEARALFKADLLRKVEGLAETSLPNKRQNLTGAGPAPRVIARTRVDKVTQSPPSKWTQIPAANSVFSMRRMSMLSPRVLVIGASTGGPAALAQFFGDMRGQLTRLPVLVVQHMPPTFTGLLADKLCRAAEMEGGEAVNGEPLVPGRLHLAPGGFHMRIEQIGDKNCIALEDGPVINHCKPAVDPLFESASEHYRGAVLGVVLTGMGTDGARGACSIADNGGSVLVQDEASSVVWGMPSAAASAGACAQIIPLQELGRKIINLVGKRSK